MTNTNDSGPGSLRYAIQEAESLPGPNLITFAAGLTGAISLGSSLDISSNVTIEGPGASSLTVSGGGASWYFSVFVVNSGVTASLSGLTIADGWSEYGGGIFNGGILTLTDVVLSGNTASEGGGGIDNDGTATLTDATISGNSAFDGGGIANYGSATLTNVTLYGNSATYGGAIGNIKGSLTLANVTIAGNSAVIGGGGIANGGTAWLNNTIVANNSGGDIEYASVSGNNNLIDDPASAGGLTNGVDGNIVAVDPLLAPLGNYGGQTETMALLPAAPPSMPAARR